MKNIKNIISNILWFIEKTVWIAIGIYLIVHLFRCYGATIENIPQNGDRVIPQSGERVMIGDFEYVLVQSPDWSQITNAIKRLEAVAERRWTREHKTVEGRRAWHGDCTNKVVSADGKTVTWFYPDGFEYMEQAMPVRSRTRPPKATGKPLPRLGQQRRLDLPDRLKAKREAIAKQPPAKEVTVTFGQGGKVLKVEDGK